MPKRTIYYLGVEYKYVGRDADGNLIYEGPGGAQITRRESDDDGEDSPTKKPTTNDLWQNYAFGGAGNPVTNTAPVIQPEYDQDIPITAGPGKFSKQGIKNEAKNNHRVIDAILQDLRVLLKRTNNVNGRPVEETIVLNGGKPGTGTYTVTFAGDLNSNGTMVPDHEVTYTYPPLPGYDPAGSSPNTETATPSGSSASGPLGTGSPSGDDGGGSSSSSSNSNSDNDVTNSSDATSSADEVTKKATDEERSDEGDKDEESEKKKKDEKEDCYPLNPYTLASAPEELREYLRRLLGQDQYQKWFRIKNISNNDTVYLKLQYSNSLEPGALAGRAKEVTIMMQQGRPGGKIHQLSHIVRIGKDGQGRWFTLNYEPVGYKELDCKVRKSTIPMSGPKPWTTLPHTPALNFRRVPPLPVIAPLPPIIAVPINFAPNDARLPNLPPRVVANLTQIANELNNNPNLGYDVFGNTGIAAPNNTPVSYMLQDSNGNPMPVNGTLIQFMLARAQAVIEFLVAVFGVKREQLFPRQGQSASGINVTFRERFLVDPIPLIPPRY